MKSLVETEGGTCGQARRGHLLKSVDPSFVNSGADS
jgi:hypothetical protein